MNRLKITDVEEGGVAYRAGMRPGDYVDTYDGAEIRSVDELLKAVDNPQGGIVRTVVIIRGEQFLELTCDEGRLGVSATEVTLDDVAYADARSAYDKAKNAQLRAAAREVILTTAPSLDGYRTEVVEVITAECAFGMNFFRDFFAATSDFFGGRSKATQKILRDARKTCLDELRLEAARVGANAVIAVDLDYSEFSGQGKSMLFLVASGTAVRAQRSGA